jgi:hypothetical protein
MTTCVLETAPQPAFAYTSATTTTSNTSVHHNNHHNNAHNNIPTTAAFHPGGYSSSYSSQASSVFSASSSLTNSTCLSFETGPDPRTGHGSSFDIPKPQELVFSNPWAHDSQRPSLPSRAQLCTQVAAPSDVAPAELRRHPRRVSAGPTERFEAPPAVASQPNRKVSFVDKVVASSTEIVKAIWPLSCVDSRIQADNGSSLPLRTFIQETLRRSRTSFSTLQVALYYLILIRPHVPKRGSTEGEMAPNDRALNCGRRMFLAALILASKYIQDRNYSARAWSRISGLSVHEINQNEISFLIAIDWRLYVAQDIFDQWTKIVAKHAPSPMPPPSPGSTRGSFYSNTHHRELRQWQTIILGISPQLDNIESLLGLDLASPTLSLMTPPLTPQPDRLGGAPAAGTQSVRGCAMAMAVAHHNSAMRSHNTVRPPSALSSSPPAMSFVPRRPSLASCSVASSPESMVSDSTQSSRSSRSSSISSASSLPGAPLNLGVQARIRQAMQCGEKVMTQPATTSLADDYYETAVVSSPETYAPSMASSSCRRGQDVPRLQHSTAACALAELQYHPYSACAPPPTTKPSLKRSRRLSNDVQDTVRDLLATAQAPAAYPAYPPKMIRAESYCMGRKRARVADGRVHETATFVDLDSYQRPTNPMTGPGMWNGIL